MGEELELDILPVLEEEFNRKLRPVIFPDCPQIRFGKRGGRRLYAIGLSTEPADKPIDGLSCPIPERNETACYMIRGELTIYEEGEPDRNYEKEVRDALATDMTEGDFN